MRRARLAEARLPEAIASLETACALDPESPGPLADLGLALAAAGQAGQAVEALRRAVSLDGAWPLDHLSLARALRAQGSLDEAQAQLDRARILAPSSALWDEEARSIDRQREALTETGVVSPDRAAERIEEPVVESVAGAAADPGMNPAVNPVADLLAQAWAARGLA